MHRITWEPPQSLMFSISSVREDTLPFTCPRLIYLPVPNYFPLKLPSKLSPPQPKSMCLKYSPNDPQVLRLLSECSHEPLKASPLNSEDHPKWVVAVAALSLYNHPTYPAHLAFWRPNVMKEMGAFVDQFLRSRESKHLQSREGWIDSELSLYTLQGHQRGFHPELYPANGSTRTLRKRKVGIISSSSLGTARELDRLLDEESGARKKTKRATTIRVKKVAAPSEVPSPESSSVPLTDAPLTGHNASLPVPDIDITIKPSSSLSYKLHRRRSSSLTSSGLSLSSSVKTLVDDETVSVASVDTAVGECERPGNMEKLAILVEAAASISKHTKSTSPLSPLCSPLPSPRRSERIIRSLKREHALEDEDQRADSRPKRRKIKSC